MSLDDNTRLAEVVRFKVGFVFVGVPFFVLCLVSLD